MNRALLLSDLLLEHIGLGESLARAAALERKGEKVSLSQQLESIASQLEQLVCDVRSLQEKL